MISKAENSELSSLEISVYVSDASTPQWIHHRSCVCSYVSKRPGQGASPKCGIRLQVRSRRRVPEVRLGEVEAHLACLARKGVTR
jgi:hypothetical protein